MSDIVIQVDRLSKRYRLGVTGTGTLARDFERWFARVRGRPDPYAKIDARLRAEAETKPFLPRESVGAARAHLRPEELLATRDLFIDKATGRVSTTPPARSEPGAWRASVPASRGSEDGPTANAQRSTLNVQRPTNADAPGGSGESPDGTAPAAGSAEKRKLGKRKAEIFEPNANTQPPTRVDATGGSGESPDGTAPAAGSAAGGADTLRGTGARTAPVGVSGAAPLIGSSSASDYVDALCDVSFEVRRGEVLGIIGRNGAGKSTLLKILSRVTAPTSGEVRVKGRIASLLEVGTGFHPELTGRENIFLNGAILGMTKAEIRGKLDEIIAFAEVERFIDTPVKRYSSGMYVRLAFAVAAHLDPEILIVDEVLAVGDAEFQKKCLGKMQDVATHGRTVLFVSHNMGMITSLCNRALLLDSGAVIADGPVSETVLSYYGQSRGSPYSADFCTSGKRVGDDHATLLYAEITDANRKPVGEVDIRSPFLLRMKYEMHMLVTRPPYANFHVLDAQGNYVFVAICNDRDNVCTVPGLYLAECTVPGHLLNNGTYFVGIALTFTHSGFHVSFFAKDALSLVVRDPIAETLTELRAGYSGPIPGPVRPSLEWHIERL